MVDSPNNHSMNNISVVSPEVVWAVSSAYPVTDEYLVRSTDGGESWTMTPIAIDSGLYAIHLYALNDTMAWLATSDEQNPISGKIYKTSDRGLSWEEQTGAFTGFNETPAGVYFWNENEGVAFGATCQTDYDDQIAIYYTESGGEDWTAVSGEDMPEQLPGERMCLASRNGFYEVVGDHIWFVTGDGRVFRSADRGKSWDAHYVIPEGGSGTLASLAFKDTLNGVAAIFPAGAATTTDGGTSWSNYRPFGFFYQSGQIEYIPGSEGTYLVGSGALPNSNRMAVSFDNGYSWEDMSTNVDLDCYQFLSPTVGFGGGIITGSADGGMYKWLGTGLTSSGHRISKVQLKVFPNPADSEVRVELSDWPVDGLQVKLYNAQGQLLRQEWLNRQGGIDVSGLSPGLYSLTALKDGQTYIGQFIKL